MTLHLNANLFLVLTEWRRQGISTSRFGIREPIRYWHVMEDKPVKLPISSFRQDVKILLCRAYCGMGDTFNQIEKCWRYAEANDRTLVIDTRDSGLLGDFSDFFGPRTNQPTVYFNPCEALQAFPNLLSDWYCQSSLKPRADRPLGACQSVVTSRTANRVQTSFDFDRSHQEQVILHESGGGGSISFHLLDRVMLAPGFREEVLHRLDHLPLDYFAVHVRNTDYQTDYKTLFERIRHRLPGQNLLVCSDDANVICYAKEFFGYSRIYQSSEIPLTHGMPLHDPSTYADPNSRRAATANAIADLLALGRAKHVFITRHAKGQTSGYSKLARHLCDNKYVIDQVLGLASDRQPLLQWQHKRWWHEFRRRLDRWVA